METIKKRKMKLKDYDISKAKYNELKYFCIQYQEKKKEVRSSYGLRSVADSGGAKGSGYSNPTEWLAIRNAMLQKDIELIEQTALEADPEIYTWILKSVTDSIPYEYMDVPMNRTDFYAIRKHFFYLLSLRR